MAQGGLSEFINQNERASNTNSRTQSDSQLHPLEQKRRKDMAANLKIDLDKNALAQPRNSRLNRVDPRPISAGHKPSFSNKSLPTGQGPCHSTFSDTDAEAADETLSSLPDFMAQQHRQPIKPESVLGGSGYGADEDEREDAYSFVHDDEDYQQNQAHDLGMKYELADYSIDGDGNTQPNQDDYMSTEVNNIFKQHGRVMSKDKRRPANPLKQMDNSTSQNDVTPRRHRFNRVEIPLRGGSVPSSDLDRDHSPINAVSKSLFGRGLQRTHSEAQEAPILVVNSQVTTQGPFDQPPAPQQRPPQPTVSKQSTTSANDLDKSRPAKASQSTLDHTSGYTSDSSDVKAVSKKRNRTEDLDYDPNALTSMRFADLQTQSFDIDPRNGLFELRTETRAVPEDVSEKMTLVQNLSPSDRERFFSTVPLAEWEECGDWLIDQFSLLLTKAKAARQERRRIATRFELEIQDRFDRIEGKQKTLDRTLAEMKGGATEVLRGKTPTKLR